MILRILIWNLFDSKTTIDELLESLAALEPPSTWIWSEASERFGIVLFDEELPEAVTVARDLIGADPVVYDEFETM